MGPVTVMLVMANAALPVLVSVRVWAAEELPLPVLGNVRLIGVSCAYPPVLPVPLSVTVCGLPPALSVIVLVPLAPPYTVGTKSTLMVQEARAAKVAPQVFV